MALHRGKERALVSKTSAILPAFLMGTKIDGGFTHYVYLPFDNNNCRYYKLDSESNKVISLDFAKEQGASFIYECLFDGISREERLPVFTSMQYNPMHPTGIQQWPI